MCHSHVSELDQEFFVQNFLSHGISTNEKRERDSNWNLQRQDDKWHSNCLRFIQSSIYKVQHVMVMHDIDVSYIQHTLHSSARAGVDVDNNDDDDETANK